MKYYEDEKETNYPFIIIGIIIFAIFGLFIFWSYLSHQSGLNKIAAVEKHNSEQFSQKFGLPIDTVDVNGRSALSRLAMAALKEPCDWANVRDLAEGLTKDKQRRSSAILYEYYDKECGSANNATWMAANIYENIGDYQSASRAIERFIEKTEENPNGCYLRGRVNFQTGNKEQAISDYLTTIQVGGGPSQVNYSVPKNLSLAYESLNMNCEAAATLQDWADVNQETSNSQISFLINQYKSRGNCADAYSKGKDQFKQSVSGSDVIFAQVEVNGQKGRFIVDTGASLVALSNSFAKRTGLNPKPNSKMLLSTANGIAYGNRMALDKIKIGGVEAQHVQGVIMQETDALPNGVDGLLGRSFLARFDVTFEKNKWTISTRK